MSYYPTCPECGDPLSINPRLDVKNKKMNIEVMCEWCSGYKGFIIETDISEKDITHKFPKEKKPFEIKARVLPPEWLKRK